MSATATVDPKDFEKRMERFGEMVERLGDTASALHQNAQGGTVAYFEDDEDTPVITGQQLKSYTPQRPVKRLPRDYVKVSRDQFKGCSDFLRLGMRKPDEFHSRYNECRKAVMKSFGLNTYEGEAGGTLVLPEFAPFILGREYSNDLWSRTRNFSVSGNTMMFPKLSGSDRRTGQREGGVRGYWTGEENTILTSQPSFERIGLRLKKLAVAVFVTEELLDDNSYALEQYVGQAVRREMNFMLGDSVFRGNGVAQPQGFLNAPGTITVAKQEGQAANTIVSENILDMWARRVAGAPIEDLVWLVNQELDAELPRMQLGTSSIGALTYMPPGGLSGAPYATLQGRPVIPTEFNEGLGDRGDIALCDFSQMLSISKGGIREAVSSEVEFLRDLLVYKFTIRVDATPADDKVITPYKGTKTQSPFIVLADRHPDPTTTAEPTTTTTAG